MKWIGQHIVDLIARFRSDVYLEDISTGTIASGSNLGLDSNNKIVKATIASGSGDLTAIVAGTGLSGTDLTGPIPTLNVDASQPSITTLAGLTSLGAAGATTDIAAGDLTMYNAVNDGAPTISIGSSATERLEITANYASGTQEVNNALFKTYTASTVGNRGRFVFSVDETTVVSVMDAGLNLSAGKALQINGTNIISGNGGGVATLSNIDALDATTEATIEATMDTLPNVTSLGTLTGLTTSGAIELGHASDTTIARSAAGVVTIEGKTIATTNKTIVSFISNFHNSSTSAFYAPFNTISDNPNLSTASYFLMISVPFDGRVLKVSTFTQSTASKTTTVEMYLNGNDSDLAADQVGTDLSIGAYSASGVGVCATDWVFSAGDALSFRITNSAAGNGQIINFVLQYDLDT